MMRLNINILIFFLFFITSCSNSDEESNITSTNETVIVEVEEAIKEPANNIWISAKKGDIESIKEHIAFGTDLNSKGSSRDETALIIAACNGHYEVVKLLVNEGADLNIQNDEELVKAGSLFTQTIFHPVGTCKMGNDENSVVNDQLKVHGIQNLRIIDASIMPNITSGNTNAPTIMIAEKGADMILGK